MCVLDVMINLPPLGSHKSLASLTVPVPSSYPLESRQNKSTFGSMGMSMTVNCSSYPYVTKQIGALKRNLLTPGVSQASLACRASVALLLLVPRLLLLVQILLIL